MDLYLLPIEGPEVILGIQWLQSLGQVSHDYKALTMEFKWKDETVVLRGDTTPITKEVSFNQLQALLNHEELTDLYELYQAQDSEEPIEQPS